MTFSREFLDETLDAVRRIDADTVDRMAAGLALVRESGGRLFILGVGGSAGHASHAVNDFRKICQFEAYTPTDNVSELTARINDEGWEGVFAEWLKTSRMSARDAILIFSVGGGNVEKNVSVKSGAGHRRSEAGRRESLRHRREGRRLHEDGCRRVRGHPRRFS